MNKLIFSWSRLTLILALPIAMLTACKKESDNTESTRVQLLSFGPTGARHGDTLRFIGTQLGKVSAIQFTGTNATVNQTDFKTQTNDLILIIVPQGAEKGYVTLKTSDGDIVSKTQFNLDVLTTITTMTLLARPGENVTITGNYLNWVDRITFNRDKVVTTFVSKSMTQLVVRVPDDAETGPLILHYGGTDSADLQSADTLRVKLPVATNLTPNPILHQTNLTITGTDLDLTKKVLFTGLSTPVTTFVSQSATQLVVKVPAETKKGKITLVPASGVQSVSSTVLDVVLPAISNMTPNPIDTGANLTITGTNLNLVKSVSFVGIANPVTSFVSQSATQLVVKVPAGTLKGFLTFGVLNSTLTVDSPVELQINGGLPPLADFPYAIYTDQLDNGFQNWSWASNNFASTANVRQGTKSIRASYNAWEGITFHNDGGPATTGYTKLELSMFGEAGTGGKVMNIVINGAWGNPATVTIMEGEWKTYSLDISNLPSPNPLKEIVLQTAGWGGVVHIDHVGLR